MRALDPLLVVCKDPLLVTVTVWPSLEDPEAPSTAASVLPRLVVTAAPAVLAPDSIPAAEALAELVGEILAEDPDCELPVVSAWLLLNTGATEPVPDKEPIPPPPPMAWATIASDPCPCV